MPTKHGWLRKSGPAFWRLARAKFQSALAKTECPESEMLHCHTLWLILNMCVWIVNPGLSLVVWICILRGIQWVCVLRSSAQKASVNSICISNSKTFTKGSSKSMMLSSQSCSMSFKVNDVKLTKTVSVSVLFF